MQKFILHVIMALGMVRVADPCSVLRCIPASVPLVSLDRSVRPILVLRGGSGSLETPVWGQTCSACSKSVVGGAGKLLRCSWCRAAFYCGKECQLAHWPSHRLNCPPTVPGAVPAPQATPAEDEAMEDPDRPPLRIRRRIAAAEDIRDQAAANNGKLPLDWRTCRACRMPVVAEWFDCPGCDRPISEIDENAGGLLPEQIAIVQHTGILGDAFRDLLLGAENNDIPLMQSAAAAGVNLTATDPDLYYSGALHYAAGQGQIEAVKWLLERGVEVDVLNECEETPLHWAAENGHTKVYPQIIILFFDTLQFCAVCCGVWGAAECCRLLQTAVCCKRAPVSSMQCQASWSRDGEGETSKFCPSTNSVPQQLLSFFNFPLNFFLMSMVLPKNSVRGAVTRRRAGAAKCEVNRMTRGCSGAEALPLLRASIAHTHTHTKERKEISLSCMCPKNCIYMYVYICNYIHIYT